MLTELMNSASPAPMIKQMDWPEAQHALLEGKKIRRLEWADAHACVFLAMFDDEYLVHRTESGKLDSLILRGADMRATDWVIVQEN